MDWLEVIKTFGFPVALVIFLIWRDDKRDKEDRDRNAEREKENNERFAGLEQFCRTDLKAIAENSISVNEKCAEAIKENKEVVTKNTSAIEETQKVLQECKLFLANNGNSRN